MYAQDEEKEKEREREERKGEGERDLTFGLLAVYVSFILKGIFFSTPWKFVLRVSRSRIFSLDVNVHQWTIFYHFFVFLIKWLYDEIIFLFNKELKLCISLTIVSLVQQRLNYSRRQKKSLSWIKSNASYILFNTYIILLARSPVSFLHCDSFSISSPRRGSSRETARVSYIIVRRTVLYT